ncbi:unnamed protein product [Mycena citricolor]|uniref:WD40 repeat-like protein n=1 Tax=Mycena citricolor TaxID=2018698 RepID=A0AAD2K860_9AGAR|nr:unnamed protein product [Mycena citricolor]
MGPAEICRPTAIGSMVREKTAATGPELVASHHCGWTHPPFLRFLANKNPRVESETHLKLKDDPGQYVTAMACVPDDGICIGLQNGSLEFLAVSGQRTRHDIDLPPKDFVESLSASDDLLLALSANGSARLIDTALCQTASSFEISSQTRSWKCHLNSRASSPYAAFGTSTDAKPLSIYSLSPSGFIPSLVLAQQDSIARRGLAVFDICQGPPCSVWAASSVVSGWYDGTLSVHDLRSSDRDRDGRLRPVMTLSNSFSDEPIYSVGCGGGSGCYVAAGSARHSLVSFWDVRSANKGFSFHAPFNDASPVYALALESSRLFAVTQSRPFVVDFGPDVDSTTYPSPSSQSATSGLGYYVTQYQHARH